MGDTELTSYGDSQWGHQTFHKRTQVSSHWGVMMSKENTYRTIFFLLEFYLKYLQKITMPPLHRESPCMPTLLNSRFCLRSTSEEERWVARSESSSEVTGRPCGAVTGWGWSQAFSRSPNWCPTCSCRSNAGLNSSTGLASWLTWP